MRGEHEQPTTNNLTLSLSRLGDDGNPLSPRLVPLPLDLFDSGMSVPSLRSPHDLCARGHCSLILPGLLQQQLPTHRRTHLPSIARILPPPT